MEVLDSSSIIDNLFGNAQEIFQIYILMRLELGNYLSESTLVKVFLK
jgi:hypothetical protein